MSNDVYNFEKITYVNIDSQSREKLPSNIYSENIRNLDNYPLFFTNNSSLVTVNLENNLYIIDDQIVLNNVVSKNVQLLNSLMIKKNSLYAKITHTNHGLTLYGLYDSSNSDEFTAVNYVDTLPGVFNETDDIPDGVIKYYILKKNANLNFQIGLSSIKGSDISRSLIGNVQTNYLNTNHVVYLLFTKQNTTYVPDRNNYLIQLKKPATINYMDNVSFLKDNMGINTTTVATNLIQVKFLTLYGIPLEYLNSGDQTTISTVKPYFRVISSTDNTFTIDVAYNAIVEPGISFYNYNDMSNNSVDILTYPYGGGTQCIALQVVSTDVGYPNPNQYVFKFDKTFVNVSEIELISTIFPNSQKTINNVATDIINNRIYWRNLSSGDYIYYLEITPGNYSLSELEYELKTAFSKTLRYEYTIEFQNGIFPPIIENSTPLIYYPNGLQQYDDNGLYKYHIVDVNISEITDIVTFTTFRELIQQEKTGESPVLTIPDYYIQFTTLQNFQIDFSYIINNNGSSQQTISPFDPTTEVLFVYFTTNSQSNIALTFPYSYNNLYQYSNLVAPSISTTSGSTTFLAMLNQTTSILLNFFRTYSTYPNFIYTNEINSINTPTLLVNFNFSLVDYRVELSNHMLSIGDLIITDQFKDQVSPNSIYVYEITSIIDSDNFTVFRYQHGHKYKFIYDSLILNFNLNDIDPTDFYYWLDNGSTVVSESMSFYKITPTAENKKFIHVTHPNHQLDVGNLITINYSGPINQVPQEAINTSHTINRIIDSDHYEVTLDKYIPLSAANYTTTLNTVTIKYPDQFQMFFSFSDTLGDILSFYKPGDSRSITNYSHVLSNTDDYLVNYNYDSLGTDYIRSLKKLNTTGFNYFYIVSPEIGLMQGTRSVKNVFAKIIWDQVQNGVCIDSFCKTKTLFDIPLSNLTQVNLSICHPTGVLVEFNNIDHSFVLKITEQLNKLTDTDINTKTTSMVHKGNNKFCI